MSYEKLEITKEEKVSVQVPHYEVKIERKKRDSMFEFKYWWEVEVFMPSEEYAEGKMNYNLNGYGYARTVSSAKKKAIKHILGIEKEVAKGVTLGLVFKVAKGRASEVIGELSEGR